MEDKFKKINEITKAWENKDFDLTHSFAGDLFKDSSWYFSRPEDEDLLVNDLVTQNQVIGKPAQSKANQAIVTPLKEVAKTDVKIDHDGLFALFVGDSFREEKGEDLLGKMIVAMKLLPHEFKRISFNENLENIENLSENLTSPTLETTEIFTAIEKNQPMVVISLGATLTNILLGKREKLSTIHGQFFNLTTPGTYNYQLMPIFHPDYLLINPNMKRTAWIDLQKVMKVIGKI